MASGACGVLITFFGGLTLYFDNPKFIYIKPTVINLLLAVVLLFDKFITKKILLKVLFKSAFNLKDESFFPWKNIAKGEFYIPKILIKENNTIEFTYSRYIDNSVQKKSIIKDYKQSLLLIKKQKTRNIEAPNIYQKWVIY